MGTWAASREKQGWEEVGKGKEGINGDERRLSVVNTKYNIQMRYYTIITLKPI